MKTIRPVGRRSLESKRAGRLIASPRGRDGPSEVLIVQDVMWLLVLAGLVAATLAYARLCDRA